MAEKCEYQVTKIIYENRMCTSCKGRKTRDVNVGNKQYKTVTCTTCDGTGVYRHIRHEYIDIRQALNEIGIYNMIKNTVKEIIGNQSAG